MSAAALRKLDALFARKRELAASAAEAPELESRLRELRTWQAARLARTYRDLHEDPRCAAAVEFFLSDLYGAHDFATRDRDVMRAWRYLKRSLPETALDALERAIELEVLTAELDLAMAAVLPAGALDEERYAKAYRAVGARQARQRQIDLAMRAGEDLERTVRRPWIRGLLRAAHGPAHAAGFGVLQDFLERGFEAFHKMGSARELLEAIRNRETALMEALFSDADDPFAAAAAAGARSG